jgi:hypothetical protein
MKPADLEAGALAYARLTDTTYALYGVGGIEGVLFWAEGCVGTDEAGEPTIHDAAWWVTFSDDPERRVRLDAPPWEALAPDADCAQTATAACAEAAAQVAAHRQVLS